MEAGDFLGGVLPHLSDGGAVLVEVDGEGGLARGGEGGGVGVGWRGGEWLAEERRQRILKKEAAKPRCDFYAQARSGRPKRS